MSSTSSAATTAPVAPREESFPALIEPFRRRGLQIGAGGLGVGLLISLISPATFLPAYLTAYVFFVGLGVGSLGFLMLHYLVGGAWGFVVRRPLEAATMTLPLMAILFLPLVVGMGWLYEWSNPEVVAAHEALKFKSGYLNTPFFLVRTALYLAIWIGLAWLVRWGSREQDQSESPAPTWRTQAISAPGLVALFLTGTFASIDWMMSIEPEWYSTIYGAMVLVGWGLSGLALGIIVASILSGLGFPSLADLARPVDFNDLGNLLLAFLMLWAYMAFSQYLIIWSGNLAEEVPWYLRRSAGGWWWVCVALMVFHFFVPFFLLLIRENKRMPARLWRIAALVVALELVHDTWLIIPASPRLQWAQLLALVPAVLGIGGLWTSVFLRHLAARPLVPRHDPLLAEALKQHGGGGHAS
jgi:hypothetical protein